ncbi:MAG: hypothetical protein IJI25_07470 [Eubacterium sp.]|nr:hypothetical protein [Eubacterium sp.]
MKKIYMFTGMITIIMIMFIWTNQNVYAKQYTSKSTIIWDITGDGKKDTITFVPKLKNVYDEDGDFTRTELKRVNIYINGKLKTKIPSFDEDCWCYSYKVFSLKNKQKYVLLNIHGSNEYSPGYILHYKNKKLVCETNITKLVSTEVNDYYPSFKKTKGNKIYFSTMSYDGLYDGTAKYEIVLKYNKGKLLLASNTYNMMPEGSSNYTLRKKVKIYKDKNGKNYKTTLKKGKKIKTTSITKKHITKKYDTYYIMGATYIIFTDCIPSVYVI